MQAVILAGGLGSRLKEVVSNVPKPMANVAGRPFLEYLLIKLKNSGVEEVFISVGYKGSIVKSFFGSGEKFGLSISYSEEGDGLLGTGGALKFAIHFFGNRLEDDFLVLNGDSFLDIDLEKFFNFHLVQNGIATIALVRVANGERYGTVKLKNNVHIILFCEKGVRGDGLINGGVYAINKEQFSLLLPEKEIFSLEKDVFPLLINRGLFGTEVEGYFIDIGIPTDYKKAEEYFKMWSMT